MRPTLQATIEALDLDLSPGTLANRVLTSITPETSILTISVEDPNRVQAALIANELANQLIFTSPTNLTPQQQIQQDLLQAEITALGEQITVARQAIQRVDQQLDQNPSAEEAATLRDERADLLEDLSGWQQTVAELSISLSTVDSQTNTLRVVESALAPSEPINNNSLRNALLAGLLGVALAFGLALLIEYLDNSIRTTEDVRIAVELPVLGGIIRFGKRNETYAEKLITLNAAGSTAVEGYRALRTNILFGRENPLRRLIVTSARIAEGKTVTASNLAVALAQSGVETVLIDADLHRPQLHRVFSLDNHIGLSTLFAKPLTGQAGFTLQELYEVLQQSSQPHLRVITSGALPTSPAEWMGGKHILALCKQLEEMLGVEAIIFDCPPVLAVTDSVPLGSAVGASVLLVVEAGKTRHESLIRAVEQFRQVGVEVSGVVLNRLTARTSSYYYYYGYGRYSKPVGSESRAR
ncbi:MAG: polysaccharide biosynthesis tyrosine autokinase [Anaerolineae bacterium]|nr:polysaccharide biosynthesis tyrosine autokinase [Anaerolineae bacterium]